MQSLNSSTVTPIPLPTHSMVFTVVSDFFTCSVRKTPCLPGASCHFWVKKNSLVKWEIVLAAPVTEAAAHAAGTRWAVLCFPNHRSPVLAGSHWLPAPPSFIPLLTIAVSTPLTSTARASLRPTLERSLPAHLTQLWSATIIRFNSCHLAFTTLG